VEFTHRLLDGFWSNVVDASAYNPHLYLDEVEKHLDRLHTLSTVYSLDGQTYQPVVEWD
jgi:hypothetical protein